MQIFLTGGTGFLGQRLLSRLARDGQTVIALTRGESGRAALERHGAQVVVGALTDPEPWASHLEGCDVVVHCAAPVETWGPWSLFEDGIVDATRRLAVASAAAGVPRFVHISSESALQNRTPLIDVDESFRPSEGPDSFYGRAKQLAEEALVVGPVPENCIVLRPPFVWGAGEKGIEKMEAKVRAGQFMWVDGGRAPFESIHVENLVDAICLALTKGKGHNVYLVTDEAGRTFREHFEPILEARGVEVPNKAISSKLARPLAAMLEGSWRAFGATKKAPPLTRFEVSFSSLPRRYDISKAKNELGYTPRVGFDEGLAELREATAGRATAA